MRSIQHHEALDLRLDVLAQDLETYDAELSVLVDELDQRDVDLEITDPNNWRKPTPTKANFVEQFRADVDSIQHMGREDEARLARRIQLARVRLEKAQKAEGLEPEKEVDAGRLALVAGLSRRINRRAMELHALRTEMVERNLYLVLINVERYAQNGASRLDLIQEGCVSLFRAVDGFDWKRGLLFRTYAVHWLNQAFRNYLYNSSHTVRVPVYLQKALKHINQTTIRLGDPHATPQEISENSNLNANLVAAAIRAARGSYSIDADVGDGDDGSRLRDLIVDEHDDPYSTRVEDVSLESGLDRALYALSEREQKVVRMRFGIGYGREHTLAEVAAELGVSVERIRQIQVRALSKLNTPTLRRELDPYMN